MRSMKEYGTMVWKHLDNAGMPTVAVVVLFLISGLAAAAPGAVSLPAMPNGLSGGFMGGATVHSSLPASTTSPRGATVGASAGGALAASPAAPMASVSSGRGTFFNNSPIPFPNGPGNQTCIRGTCVNNSNDPSLNLTSRGVLAVAYTEYTNESPCTNVSAYAQSEIGFSASTDGGTTWSTPIYLGNTNCSVANQYASSWQPSLTSLANGTLVLAFIAFNFSSTASSLPYVNFGPYQWNVRSAALLLTESYDNGSTWTSPQMLNATVNVGLNSHSWTPERPWITAYGDTVYVSWMNETEGTGFNCCFTAVGSAQVHLLVSKNGGGSWGSPINVSNVISSSNISVGEDPYLLTDPSGELYLAYVTNWTFWWPYCIPRLCDYGMFTADIEVAYSTNNGTTFSYAAVAREVPDQGFGGQVVAPELAYSATYGQLYAVFPGQTPQMYCLPFGCLTQFIPADYFANSSTHGATWSPARLVTALSSNGALEEFEPTLAITSDGTIHLATMYFNRTPGACLQYTNGCPQLEAYLTSTDNGTTFSSPVIVSSNATDFPTAPWGEYATSVSQGANVWFAWAHEVSNLTPSTYVYFPSTHLVAQVTVSQLFQGTGLTVTFQEKGLPAGTSWSVDMMGNARSGSTPTSLSLSGIPSSEILTWTTPNATGGYGVRYVPNASLLPPAAFTASSTVYDNFSERVLVNVTTSPNVPGCSGIFYSQYCWDNPYTIDDTYNVTPAPNVYWVPVNTSFTESVTPNIQYGCTYCYLQWMNVTFRSWTGSGAGSVNSSSNNISFKALGPINETANFRLNGFCTYFTYHTPKLQCSDLNQSLVFHESGLPANVTWSVTLWGATGVPTSASSNGSWLTVTNVSTLGTVTYVVWTIPIGTTGRYWIGSGDPASPVELPGQRIINVTFSIGTPSAGAFPTFFRESGLPNQTAWTLDIGASTYGVENTTYNTSLPGGSETVGAEPVYLNNASGYYLSGVSTESFVENRTSTWTNSSTVPATLAIDGAAFIVLTYSPEFWAEVHAGIGGSVTPSSQWVHSGAALALNATPDPGYFFVDWSGRGSGSVSGATQNPVAHPTGPILELATFEAIPPPLWTVDVSATGLPAGTDYSATIGNRTISGSGTLNVTGLPSGTYPVSFAYAYDNASNSTRYAPTGWTSSLTSPTPGEVTVTSNGSVSVSFETQYLLTVTSTGSGAVAPAPGAGWWASGSTASLTATPDPHYQLAGWFGTGTGSVTTTNPQDLVITPTVNGPITETAQFIWKPTSPPETFNLTVTASGLPSGQTWNVSAGATGVEGSGATLKVPGLNGTYTVAIAPVLISPGVRYVANGSGNFSVPVTGNAQLNVSFTEQYLLTVSGSPGGNVTPGTEWVDAGATVTLTALPLNASWAFVSWNGTGAGNYTGNASTEPLTMGAPLSEVATFGPVYPIHTTGSATAGLTTDLALFVVLLAIALAIGAIAGRRRPPRGEMVESPSEDGGADDGSGAPAESEAEAPAMEYDENPSTAPAVADYDEGRAPP